MIRSKKGMTDSAQKPLKGSQGAITHAEGVMSQDEGEQPKKGVYHENPVLAGKMVQPAGVLTSL
tara:strand:+ start:33 stop:224 length:192 start_codon:yes stop_codon:yes gene_type:complete